AYLVLVLAHALAPADEPVALLVSVPRMGEASALLLALVSALLGLVHWQAYLAIPDGSASNPLAVGEIAKALWPMLAGAVLAILLGRWDHGAPRAGIAKVFKVLGPLRRAGVALGTMVERVDAMCREWPAAGLSLLTLVILFAAAMQGKP